MTIPHLFEIQRPIAFALVEQYGDQAEDALDRLVREMTRMKASRSGWHIASEVKVVLPDLPIARTANFALSKIGTLTVSMPLGKAVKWEHGRILIKEALPETLYMAVTASPLAKTIAHPWLDDRIVIVRGKSKWETNMITVATEQNTSKTKKAFEIARKMMTP